MIHIRRHGYVFDEAVIAVAISTLFVCILGMTIYACATAKVVGRTVNDVAKVACQVFGQQHPDEFAYLVSSVTPEIERKKGISVKALCDVHEVLHPFIREQFRLQQEISAGLRQQMESPNAPASQ